MNYVHCPNFESIPSARERIAALRKVNEGKLRALRPLAKSGSVGACRGMDRAEDRQFILDVADILLDAMKHGPDNPIVRDIPGRSQMQEQGPLEGFPHTGLPPDKL